MKIIEVTVDDINTDFDACNVDNHNENENYENYNNDDSNDDASCCRSHCIHNSR